MSHMLSERKSLNDDEEIHNEEQKSLGESDKDKDDEASDGSQELLVPIAISRALSAPLEIGEKRKKKSPIKLRKQSSDYSDWIESYRKWKQWKNKDEDVSDNLFSPNISPIRAILAFAKSSSEIGNPEELRQTFFDQ
jgi:hypothetical protein